MSVAAWVKAVAFLCILGASAGQVAADGQYLTGAERAVWLVICDEQLARFDIAAKPIGKDWRWFANGISGKVVATGAMGDGLHVLLSGGGYLIFPLSQPSSPLVGRTLHAAPLAVCAAPAGFASADTPTILAITPSAAPPDPGRDAHPSSESLAPQSTAPGGWAVYQNLGNRWTQVTDPAQQPVGPNDKLLATATETALYVFIRDTVSGRNRLVRWEAGQWTPIKLEPPLAHAKVPAMTRLDGKVVLVFATAAESQGLEKTLTIAVLGPQQQKFIYQPMILADAAATWPGDMPILVGRLGDRVAMVWDKEQIRQFTTCGLDGQLLAPVEMKLLPGPGQDDSGRRILDYFMWAVMVGIFIPLLAFRPRTPPKPFVLGEGVRTAPLGKRLIALVVDFLPFYMLGFVVFRPPGLGDHPLELSEILRIAQQYSMSPAGAYAQILTFLSFTAYGVLMELRFGATVGKLIFKLRVIGSEGTRAGPRAVLLRNLVKIVELYWPPLFLLVVLLVALNRNHQRLGDLMGQTAVIDSCATPPEPEQSQPTDTAPPGPPPSE